MPKNRKRDLPSAYLPVQPVTVQPSSSPARLLLCLVPRAYWHCACRARARRPSGAVETMTGSTSQLGRPVGPLGCQAAGKVQVGFFLYLFSFLFFWHMFWFNNNTKSFYFLMPIFVGTSGIIPDLLNKWHNFWTYIIYIKNIYAMQIIMH